MLIMVVIAAIFIALILLPIPIALLLQAGVHQGMIRSMQGDDVSLLGLFVLSPSYVPRVLGLGFIVLIVFTPLAFTIICIPLVWAFSIVTFSLLDFLLLSQPHLNVFQVVKLSIVGNMKNLGPLIIVGLVCIVLTEVGEVNLILNMILYGFIVIIQTVYAAKVFGICRDPSEVERIAPVDAPLSSDGYQMAVAGGYYVQPAPQTTNYYQQ